MITPFILIMNQRIFYNWDWFLVNQKIIYSPSFVIFTMFKHIIPISEFLFLWIKMSKCVNIFMVFKKIIKWFPFLWSIPSQFILAFFIKHINCIMSNIKITCQYNCFIFVFQIFYIFEKFNIPFLCSVFESVQTWTWVRGVDSN